MSQSIRCLIIDDEPLSHRLLTEHIDRTACPRLVGAASNAPDALQLCQELEPDLLLLDIQMPRMSGIELLELLPQPHPFVVITSAFREYALKGFEFGVVDFLYKPIFFDRFRQAIQRVEDRFTQRALNATLLQESAAPDTVSVRVGSSQVNIPVDTINFVEACQNYVKIQQREQPTAILSKITLAEVETKLPEKLFTRIHRKYIIRVDQVYRLFPFTVQLFSGENLPIGITYQDSVRKVLRNRM